MKRIIAIIMSITMSASLTACGNDYKSKYDSLLDNYNTLANDYNELVREHNSRKQTEAATEATTEPATTTTITTTTTTTATATTTTTAVKTEPATKKATEPPTEKETEKTVEEEPVYEEDDYYSSRVYITRTGRKYHYDNHCNGGKYFESTLQEAESKGLKPCNKCVN